MPAPVTLQPHICGACESPITPYRSVVDGRQCKCAEPCSPAPAPNGSLYLFAKDPIEVRIMEEQQDVAPLERMRLELGATPTELAGERIHDAREALIEAMKIADRHRETDPFASDLHRRTCELVSDLDDHLAWVAERSVR
jgi:hypothetical protein